MTKSAGRLRRGAGTDYAQSSARVYLDPWMESHTAARRNHDLNFDVTALFYYTLSMGSSWPNPVRGGREPWKQNLRQRPPRSGVPEHRKSAVPCGRACSRYGASVRRMLRT